jgi:hypothetical protein
MKTTFNHCLKTILFFTAITFLSCSDKELTYEGEQSQNVEEKISIVKFENFDEFNKLIDQLSFLSNDELEYWIEQNNPDALYSSNKVKEDQYNLPESYLAIFNSQSEIKFQDKILWLNASNIYELELNNDRTFLKNDVDNLKPIGEISVKVYKLNNQDDPKSTIVDSNGGLSAKYQHEFQGLEFRDCSNNYRSINARLKYVHEILSIQSFFGLGAASSKLYLRVKLEWRGRGSWKRAGEPRNISVNLNLNNTKLSFFTNGIPSETLIYNPSSINVNYTCSGDKSILLKSSDSYGTGAGYPSWIVNTSGTISQELHGGYHEWSHFANW